MKQKGKSSKSKKWIKTIAGGLLGLLLSLVVIGGSILLFHELYYIFLMVMPILTALFIRVLGGYRNRYSLCYTTAFSLIGTFLSAILANAGSLVDAFSLPAYELPRLSVLMLFEFNKYGVAAWNDLTADIFRIIISLAYLLVGILVAWEFIVKLSPSEKKKAAASSEDDDEYEYIYVEEADEK